MTNTNTTEKPAARKAPAKKAPAKAAPKAEGPKAKDGVSWIPTGKDGETHKCRSCNKALPVRKFPTITGPMHRGTECRACRDIRTNRAVKRLSEPAVVAKAAAAKVTSKSTAKVSSAKPPTAKATAKRTPKPKASAA